MNNNSHISHENLKLSDFLRSDAGDSILVTGSMTPNALTELRQRHESKGVICLSAQMEFAWLNEDDDTVRDIALLQDNLKSLTTL